MVRHPASPRAPWNRWRSQYGGMKADDAKRPRQIEPENARLKKLLAEAEPDKAMLKELAEEPFNPGAPWDRGTGRELSRARPPPRGAGRRGVVQGAD